MYTRGEVQGSRHGRSSMSVTGVPAVTASHRLSSFGIIGMTTV